MRLIGQTAYDARRGSTDKPGEPFTDAEEYEGVELMDALHRSLMLRDTLERVAAALLMHRDEVLARASALFTELDSTIE